MSAPKRASKRSRNNVEETHTISPRSKSAKISHPKEESVANRTHNRHSESNPEDEKVIAPALSISEEDDDEETDDGEDENDEPDTFMAITAHQGQIGAAFFDPAERTLQLLEDTSESHHFDLSRLVFEQLHPDIVLSSSRADEALIRQCQIYMDETASRFQVRPHKEFSPDQGKEKLLSLRVISEIGDYENTEENPSANAYDFMRSRDGNATDPYTKKWTASIRTSNFANMTAPLCMSAAGALLDHLVRIHATDLSVEGIGGLDIVDIHALSLEKSMLINVDALHSLQVFSPESHASIHSEKTKEGLSLFGIMDHTRTKSGRALLKRWFLRPSLDVQTIRSRHDALDCFLSGENLAAVGALQSHLRGLKSTPRTMATLKNGKAGLNEWRALVKFTYHAIMLREAIGELSSSAGIDIVERVASNQNLSREGLE